MTSKILKNTNPFTNPAEKVRLADLSELVPAVDLGSPNTTRPASRTLYLYAAGAPHLANFCRRVGLNAFKLGITASSPEKRVSGLGAIKYAGLWGPPGVPLEKMTVLEGADKWIQIPLRKPAIPAASAGLEGHQIRHFDRHIEFDVPPYVDDDLVNQALNSVFANRCLKRFIGSDNGQIRLRNAKIDAQGWFHTLYPSTQSNQKDRLCSVQELFVFDARSEMAMISTAVQAMVDHLTRSSI